MIETFVNHKVTKQTYGRIASLFLAGALLMGCGESNNMAAPESAATSAHQTVSSMMTNGMLEQSVAVNEKIGINATPEATKWRVVVGRRDMENAEFEMFPNESQANVRFTKAGSYELTVNSAGGNQNVAIRNTLTVVVK